MSLKESKSAPNPRSESFCFVYFVTADGIEDYPIKIGVAYGSVEKRIKALQTGCPYKLKVLAVTEATPKLEWVLHCQLREHRLSGEWFNRHPDVMAEVKKATARQKKIDNQRQLYQEAWDALPREVRERVRPSVPDWREMADRLDRS